jgi:hypothetical protein
MSEEPTVYLNPMTVYLNPTVEHHRLLSDYLGDLTVQMTRTTMVLQSIVGLLQGSPGDWDEEQRGALHGLNLKLLLELQKVSAGLQNVHEAELAQLRRMRALFEDGAA